jgi:hypothetical protein
MPEDVSEPTRRIRGAANAAAFAIVLFGVLFLVSTQIGSVRAHSPWANDPYDFVATFAVITLGLVAALTWIRSQRYRGVRELPPVAAEQIMRGIALALAVLVTVAGTDGLGMALGTRRGAWSGVTPLLGALFALFVVATGVALVLFVRALRVASLRRPVVTGTGQFTPPDVFDDTSRMLADHASVPLVGPAIAASGRVLDSLASSPAGPRRHRWLWIVGAGLAFGTSLAVVHGVREGAWASITAAVIFTLIGSLLIVLPFALFGPWLDVIRPDDGGSLHARS